MATQIEIAAAMAVMEKSMTPFDFAAMRKSIGVHPFNKMVNDMLDAANDAFVKQLRIKARREYDIDLHDFDEEIPF